MARIFIDGFESGSDDLWDTESNANVVSSAGKDMDGDYCLDLDASAEYVQKDITADDEMYFAFLWRPADATNAEAILAVFKDGTLLVHLACTGGLATCMKAYRGTGVGNIIGTGTKTFSINTTYLVEVRIKIADSPNGVVQVKFDGIMDIDVTNGDTKPGADTQFNKVYLGYASQIGIYTNAFFDNFIMDDYTWIGDTKVQKILPTGGGSSTIWTPSVGANWACVDERPPSDVDYVSTNVVDQVDTYVAANMAGSIESVKCVQIQSRTESDGAPTPTNLKLAVRSGAVDYFSADKSVPVTPKGLWNLWENNPADSLAWEEADVNAMEIGIKSAA